MYRLEVSHNVHHQMRRMPAAAHAGINRAVASLAENPRHPGCKKLTDRGGYRLRVGDYRVLYRIDEDIKTVTVHRVMARGDVYRL